jgi:pimeloyl-ACP methyl ester carboxylesterase
MAHWMWQPQMAPLGERYITFAPDLPGVSGSCASTPFTLTGAADVVIDLIRQQGYDHAHMCGLSLGAMVAVEVALRAPDLTTSLILSGGQVHPKSLLMGVQRRALARASERDLMKPPALLVKRFPDLAPAATENMRALGKQRLLEAVDALSQVDFRHRLPDITAPTLVLCGSRDWPNRRAARALAHGIPQAQLRIIRGVGHVWNLERPDLFTRIVLEFLQKGDVCEQRDPGQAKGDIGVSSPDAVDSSHPSAVAARMAAVR